MQKPEFMTQCIFTLHYRASFIFTRRILASVTYDAFAPSHLEIRMATISCNLCSIYFSAPDVKCIIFYTINYSECFILTLFYFSFGTLSWSRVVFKFSWLFIVTCTRSIFEPVPVSFMEISNVLWPVKNLNYLLVQITRILISTPWLIKYLS